MGGEALVNGHGGKKQNGRYTGIGFERRQRRFYGVERALGVNPKIARDILARQPCDGFEINGAHRVAKPRQRLARFADCCDDRRLILDIGARIAGPAKRFGGCSQFRHVAPDEMDIIAPRFNRTRYR